MFDACHVLNDIHNSSLTVKRERNYLVVLNKTCLIFRKVTVFHLFVCSATPSLTCTIIVKNWPNETDPDNFQFCRVGCSLRILFWIQTQL